VRIALLTYRGNMFCGGQGIYAAYLAREWKRAGHDVHVIAGPPLPEIDPGIPLHVIPNANVFGVKHPEWARREDPLELLNPVTLWELGVSRFGVFPRCRASASACSHAGAGSSGAIASTSCSTTSACRGGCWGSRPPARPWSR
jgi:hypothetical protein